MHNSTFSHYFPSSPTARCWKLFTTISLLFFSFQGLQAQTRPTGCTNCTQTITLPGGANAAVSTGNNQVICLQGTGTFTGMVNLNGNNSALCVGPNVRFAQNANLNFRGNNVVITNFGTWERPFDIANNSVAIVDNYGTMSFSGNITISGNAIFTNYGRFSLTGNLIIANGNNTFTNQTAGEAAVAGNVEVNGNGNNNGFFQAGTMTVGGNFRNADSNANSSIRGNINIGGNLEVLGGGFEVVKAIVDIGGNYTQRGNNSRVTGSSALTDICGAFKVAGTSEIFDGTFGFQGARLGMCDNEASPTGFDVVSNPSDVEASGRLKCDCYNQLVQALPVTLLYFTARQTGNQVALHWATASETDNDYFSIEKSRDGQQFNQAGRVAGAGTSLAKLTYGFNDDFPFGGASYYRLKQVDLNGMFTYSKTVKVSSDITSALRVYPNPLTENELWVEASGDQSSDMRIIIQNAIGKRVLDATYVYDPVVKVDLTRLRREPGLYMITVRRKNRIERQKLVIQ